jgi:hypothetical protein
MDFLPIRFDRQALASYNVLFETCFSRLPKFELSSLDWLYTQNPDGPAVGFDAIVDSELAAHYVCVPTTIRLNGVLERALLSLNTATHPKYQGKGLFTKLATMTYRLAAEQGYKSVFGVANANSTPGFVRKLGFQLVEPLKAMVGIGRLDANFDYIAKNAQFERVWTQSALAWRCSNPANPICCRTKNGIAGFEAQAMGDRLRAYAELPATNIAVPSPPTRLLPFRLYLGLAPTGACLFKNYLNIPNRFRPSPLNFIFKDLGDGGRCPESGRLSFSFLDFDAY